MKMMEFEKKSHVEAAPVIFSPKRKQKSAAYTRVFTVILSSNTIRFLKIATVRF